MGPAAHQSRRQVLKLGQLHLQFTFVGARPLGEDIQNQAGAIQHSAFEQLFQITLLHRTQRMVEQHHIRLFPLHAGAHFLGLAGADKITGMRRTARTGDRGHRFRAGGNHQFAEFTQIFTVEFSKQIEMNEHRPFTLLWTFKQTALS